MGLCKLGQRQLGLCKLGFGQLGQRLLGQLTVGPGVERRALVPHTWGCRYPICLAAHTALNRR